MNKKRIERWIEEREQVAKKVIAKPGKEYREFWTGYLRCLGDLKVEIGYRRKMRKVNKGHIWFGRDWEEAIKLSLETPDCGIEEVTRYAHPGKLLDDTKKVIGYQIYGWGNGYRHKYKTRIPAKYNEMVKKLLNK